MGEDVRDTEVAEQLDAVALVNSGIGYEMCDSEGVTMALHKSWDTVAAIFRQADYSEEYIASRKAKADRRHGRW